MADPKPADLRATCRAKLNDPDSSLRLGITITQRVMEEGARDACPDRGARKPLAVTERGAQRQRRDMDPKLQQTLAEIVKSLTEAANQVGTVAKEQLPLLVQEYLRKDSGQPQVPPIGRRLLLAACLLLGGFFLCFRDGQKPNYSGRLGRLGIIGCALIIVGMFAAWSLSLEGTYGWWL